MSYAIYQLLMSIIGIYIFIIFAWVIASWLQMFGIINTRNAFARNVMSVIDSLVDPVVRPIRKIIPPMGGLDLSPIILFLGLSFLRNFIHSVYTKGTIL